MPRTTFASLGYQRRRVHVMLQAHEWRLLEDEADRRAMPLGSTISTILGLAVANRELVNSITQDLRDESAARAKGGPVR